MRSPGVRRSGYPSPIAQLFKSSVPHSPARLAQRAKELSGAMCSLRGAVRTHWRWLQFSAPPAEQMLGLPGVRAAKVLAQDQLDVVGGSWRSSVSFPFLPSPHRDRSPAPSCRVALTLVWCNERVMPCFLVFLRPVCEGHWETRASLILPPACCVVSGCWASEA